MKFCIFSQFFDIVYKFTFWSTLMAMKWTWIQTISWTYFAIDIWYIFVRIYRLQHPAMFVHLIMPSLYISCKSSSCNIIFECMDPEKRMNAFSAYSTFSQFYLCAKVQITTYTLFSNSSTFGLHKESPHQAVKLVFKNYQQDKSSTRDATRTVQKSRKVSGDRGSGGLKLELFLNQNCPESHQLTRMVVTHTIHAWGKKEKKKKSESLNVWKSRKNGIPDCTRTHVGQVEWCYCSGMLWLHMLDLLKNFRAKVIHKLLHHHLVLLWCW